jgi:hypothetical protein
MGEQLRELRADRFLARAHSLLNAARPTRPRKKTFVTNLESFVRQECEELFGAPFKKVRPAWLTNPASGRPLELDLYNADIGCPGFPGGLAIEVQGRGHYTRVASFYRSEAEFQAVLARDALKRRMCADRGVLLIEVPYYLKRQEVQAFVMSEYWRLIALRLGEPRPKAPSDATDRRDCTRYSGRGSSAASGPPPHKPAASGRRPAPLPSPPEEKRLHHQIPR